MDFRNFKTEQLSVDFLLVPTFQRIYAALALSTVLAVAVGCVVGQTSTCRIMEKTGSLETFSGEGLDSSSDGSVMYGQVDKTGELKIWNSRNGRLINTFRNNGKEAFSRNAEFTTDKNGNLIAARTKDSGMVWIGETETGKTISQFETFNFGTASITRLSPSGEVLFTAKYGGGAALWDVRKGRQIAALTHPDLEPAPGEFYTFSSADFSPDGSLLAVAFYAHIYLWESRSGKFIKRIYITDTDPHNKRKTISFSNRSAIYSLRFSPDGSLLASGGRDWTTQLWEVESGKLRASLKQSDRVFKVSFSNDGRFLATVSYDDRKIKLWDSTTGKLLYELKGGRSSPFSITFSSPQIGIIAVPVGRAVEFRKIESGHIVEKCEGTFGYFLPKGESFISSTNGRGLDIFRIK